METLIMEKDEAAAASQVDFRKVIILTIMDVWFNTKTQYDKISKVVEEFKPMRACTLV